ncbi:MAG: helix-turn-helix transcriptional regulator [Cyclobacteriaceae bacterium]|nr:helix-turn-helix transcriptional regulator [Cyclobacteriaceae bacterium]
MNQFILQQGHARELHAFPHILEFALKKNNSIQLNSLHATSTDSVRIYSIVDGKFEWVIGEQNHILYPGDLAVILPGQTFRGEKDILNIGTLSWIHLRLEKIDATGMSLGKWSYLSRTECLTIGKILLLNLTTVLKLKECQGILTTLRQELMNQEIGFTTRVNQLIDELFISIARQSTRQNNSQRDFPQTFMKLEQTLRQNLAHQWTVEEMAALIGLGTTTFTEKVKNYTGFSPLNYLINIRISEAIKLLNRQDENVTDIALGTGFYSSQHFSTTFKKLTGYTPSEFRKRNLPSK